MEDLLKKVRNDFPTVTFTKGKDFYWSPATSQVFYDFSAKKDSLNGAYALLHELSHGLLKHISYDNDYELLQLEVAAWEQAKHIARRYSIKINDEHIQDCLDSYRDWLHRRCVCPICSLESLQKDFHCTYECFNCGATWKVGRTRFCRAYRLSASSK